MITSFEWANHKFALRPQDIDRTVVRAWGGRMHNKGKTLQCYALYARRTVADQTMEARLAHFYADAPLSLDEMATVRSMAYHAPCLNQGDLT